MLQYDDLPDGLKDALNQKGADKDTVDVLLLLLNAANTSGGGVRKEKWDNLPSATRDVVTRNRRIMRYEQEMQHAMAAADDAEVARITRDYNTARGVPNDASDWITWDADATGVDVTGEEDAETRAAVGTAVAERGDEASTPGTSLAHLTTEEREWLAAKRAGKEQA